MEEHIKTYVNAFTRGLGKEGRAAVMELEKRALAAGVISLLGFFLQRRWKRQHSKIENYLVIL